MIDFFLTRRSTPLKNMGEKAPTREEIEQILTAAARTPDHGKYVPWYFVIFEGDSRREVGKILRKGWAIDNPDAESAKLDLESERFLRAPLVIGVISRIREGKHPQWEQILSAGAVCMNLCHAANALGFGSNWLTEWYSYNDYFKTALGLDDRDHIAGFIYIGEQKEKPEDRDRPDLNKITTWWKKDTPIQKGDLYGLLGQGYPQSGFKPPI